MKEPLSLAYAIMALTLPVGATVTATILAGGETDLPADTPSGRLDKEGTFSFVGALEISSGGGNYKGSAVALSREWVLTAGHNTDLNDDGLPDAVWSGVFHLPGFGSFGVAQVFTNPGFTGFANPSVNDDLALLRLATPLPTGMGFPTLGSGAAIGDFVTLVGFGRSGYGSYGYTSNASLTDRRFGSNVIDGFQMDDEDSGRAEVFRYDFDAPNSVGILGGSLGNDMETIIGPGDSGGAALRQTANGWDLVGINTFTEGYGGRFGDTGGGVLVEPYIDWISQTTGIPEPSGFYMFTLSTLFLLRRGRPLKNHKRFARLIGGHFVVGSMSKHLLPGLIAASGFGIGFASAQSPTVLSGKISDVTVYQGSALISRVVEIPAGPQAAMEVVVSGLPSATDSNSVYADQAKGVEIRSVAFRSKAPDEAAQAQSEVSKLDLAIKELRRKSAIDNNEIALRRIRQDFLKRLGSEFVAPAAKQEMTHGVLQADELSKLTRLHFEEYEKASQEIMKLYLQIEENEEQLAKLEQRRKTLAAGPPVGYEAVVYLQKTSDGPATLKLNYLVNDCGWNPSYNFRGDTAKNEVSMEFNAIVHQVSGEDWNDVKLALSTASPSVGAYNPQLSPLFVRVQPGGAQEASQSASQSKYSQALTLRQEALAKQFRGNSIDEMLRANFSANESAASVQLIELTERIGNLRALEGGMAEQGSVLYSIGRSVSLQSRRDAQMVPVLSGKMKSKFYQVAAPVLTSSVFREASLANNTGRDLLGGKVNVYLDGEFTGRTDIPTIASGQGFAISFGVDTQLRARRSLVDRTEIVQGGNRQISFTYEIVVDNYKQGPARLILRDRTPHTGDTDTLRVNLGQCSSPLSEDADYQRFEKPKGLLMWDIEIKPGAGPAATTLRYAYSVEWDKNLNLQDIGGSEKDRMREEFMQKGRNIKGH